MEYFPVPENFRYPATRSTRLFFVFRMHFYTVKVYEDQLDFARHILEAADLEICAKEDSSQWCEVDTRLLIYLFVLAIPKMIVEMVPQGEELIRRLSSIFNVKVEE